MNLFDQVTSKDYNPDELFKESVEDEPEDEGLQLMTEAVYPEALRYNYVMTKKVTIPQKDPSGKAGFGNLAFLYSNSFDESVKLITSTDNCLRGPRYKNYYYNWKYVGRLCNKTYRIRNFNLRKEYYAKMKSNYGMLTVLNPDPNRNPNMYYDLHTFIDIFGTYTKKTSVKRIVTSYWAFMKPVLLNSFPQYKNRFVICDLQNFTVSKVLKENLYNPLYMIFYTLFKFPDQLSGINLDFYFYYGNKIMKINPGTLDKKRDLTKIRTQMNRLLSMLPQEAIDDKEINAQTLASEIETETKTKLGLNEQQNTVPEFIHDDVRTVRNEDKLEETPLEKEVEKTAMRSATRVVDAVKTDENGNLNEEKKAKAVAQMAVDSSINEERRILETAYNKLKHDKLPSSTASTARDQKLLDGEKELQIHGVTVEQMEKITANNIKVTPKDVSKVAKTPNHNMTTMTYYQRNHEYIEKLMPKDIMNVLLALNTKSIPMYIRDIKIEDTSDELNYKETYTVMLEDKNRQRHTIKFDIPKILEDRFLYLGGDKKIIKNQTYFYPIVKIKESEVQITSNYNKMFIRRIDTKSISAIERLKKFLKSDDRIKNLVKFGNANSVNKTGSFITTIEYDEMAKMMRYFKCGNTAIYFSQFDVQELMEKKGTKPKDGYLCVGYTGDKPIFVKNDGTQRTDDGKSITDVMVEALPDDLRESYYKTKSPKRLMYVNVKVMDQFISVAMLLGFWEGLDTVLKKCKAEYRLEDHMPKQLKPSENVIRFADTFLVYEDTMEAGLLLNGIRLFTTEKWNIADFNGKEPYIEYFQKVYGKAIITNALMNFYEWFIDPVTLETLQDVGLPTDIVSLVIYATSLLADNQHTSQLNQHITRIRSFEIIPMVLYGILARQYVPYRNSNGSRKYSIPRDGVIKELLGIVTVEGSSTLSPALEMINTRGVSMKGFHGVNLDDAYTIGARSYDNSMRGIISPISSPDAGCGLNKTLVLEPKLTNLRGYAEVAETKEDVDNLKDVNIFGPAELSMPGTSYIDDPTRSGHAMKQTTHVIPVNDSDPCLVSNGFENIERFELSSDFVVNAEEDGVVEKYDQDLKIIVVRYKSGKCRAVNMDTHIVKNGGGGFYLNNELVTDLKEGDKVKKDDVIAYHKNFFTNSKYNACRGNVGTLARVAVMSSYNTYEDATVITESLSERCGTKMTECKKCVIGKNSNVMYIAEEGSEISVGDTLVSFDTSYDDTDLNTMLAALGDDDDLKGVVQENSRNTIKSKYGGKLISIKMYSTVELNELSPSLQKIFKAYYAKINKKKKLLEEYDPESENSVVKCGVLFTETTKKINPDKYGNIRGQNVEDGVLIEFYIEELEPLEVASKIACYTGLKNTIGEVIPKGYEPYTDYLPDKKIDTFIADNSILKRMVPSILQVGFGNKLVVGFKEYLRDIWES